MGIPGLTVRLIGRGHWITMEHRQKDQGNAAILDGPGLAYYIGRQYREDNLANTLTELSPAYSDIGARAVRFLEDLEAVGLRM